MNKGIRFTDAFNQGAVAQVVERGSRDMRLGKFCLRMGTFAGLYYVDLAPSGEEVIFQRDKLVSNAIFREKERHIAVRCGRQARHPHHEKVGRTAGHGGAGHPQYRLHRLFYDSRA